MMMVWMPIKGPWTPIGSLVQAGGRAELPLGGQSIRLAVRDPEVILVREERGIPVRERRVCHQQRLISASLS
ncbi:hypothetical protein GOODEAATRI_001613 [Goodea atripinnis]|uniref:Uncharacterized protein n=1 Tax=Goodea atripinnis TaxID=208336 RepID=A0ABV0P0S8_9TELE